MAAVSGKSGYITWYDVGEALNMLPFDDSEPPVECPIRGWSADIIVDMFDATSMAATAPTGRERVVGLQDATGTISFVTPSGGGTTTVLAAMAHGLPVNLCLYPDETGVAKKYYNLDAILSGVHPTLEVGGENLLTYDFQMSDKGGVSVETVAE